MAIESLRNFLRLTEPCGCESKLPAANFRQFFSSIFASRDLRLLVGPDTFDDIPVYRLMDDGLIVPTAVEQEPWFEGEYP